MNKRVPIIIAILLFILVIIMGIIVAKKLKRIVDAIDYSLINDIECGQHVCGRNIENLSIPTVNFTTYNLSLAKYCADLIIRVETQGVKADVDGMQKLDMIYDVPGDPPLCVLWKKDDTLWIALKGTTNFQEFKDDIDYEQVPIGDGAMVHKGFHDVSLKILPDISEIIKQENIKSVVVAGHSLGAGVSTIIGYYLGISMGNNVVVYNFASPRVGNPQFCANMKPKLFRHVNSYDLIPTLPFSVSPNFNDINKPYIYSDCGQLISFSLNWKSMLNNHMMGVYLAGLKI